MIDHLGIEVADYARSRAFYEHVLATLGHGIVMEVTRDMTGGYEGCGFGPPGRPHFWVGKSDGEPGRGAHIAFTAGSRAQVDLVEATLLRAYLNAGRVAEARHLLANRRPGPAMLPVQGLDAGSQSD